MRVCVVKATNKLIEMQSDATEGTLIQNAINAGYVAGDIEEKEATEEEFQAIIDAQPVIPQPLSELEQTKQAAAQTSSDLQALMDYLAETGVL